MQCQGINPNACKSQSCAFNASHAVAGNVGSHDKVVTDMQSVLMLIPELRKVTLQQLSDTLPASLVGLALQPEAQPQQRFDAMASAVQRITSAIGSKVSHHSSSEANDLTLKTSCIDILPYYVPDLTILRHYPHMCAVLFVELLLAA